MTLDLKIIPDQSGNVEFGAPANLSFPGSLPVASPDTGLMLLQRLYIIMFSEPGTAYRKDTGGMSLLQFLDGANTPPAGVMNSIMSIVC